MATCPTVLKTLVALMLSAVATAIKREQKCEHSKFQADLNVHPHDFDAKHFNRVSNLDRLMQSGTETTHKMVIIADFNAIPDGYNKTWIKAVYEGYSLKRIMEIMSVTNTPQMPVLRTTTCSGLSLPANYTNGSLTADLIIMVKTYQQNTSTLATGGWCALSSKNRPVIGVMNINTWYLKPTGEDDIEYMGNIYIHETFHAMGFSGSLFKYFPNQINSTVNLTTSAGTFTNIPMIVSPGVVAWGKSHFACDTLTGIPFENEGGSGTAGAHWEKTIMGNEGMTGVASGKMVFTQATFNFFQDSGLYTADMSLADVATWGKGQGCSFMNHRCSTSFTKEFGVSNARMCSRDYTIKTIASRGTVTDTCQQFNFFSTYRCNQGLKFNTNVANETYGANSRCFQVNRPRWTPSGTFGCFKSYCVNNTVIFTSSSTNYTCTQSGQNITTGDNVIQCPDLTDFCGQLNQKCPDDCNGNGRCQIGGTCRCFFFYEGDRCQTKKTCDFGPDICKIQGVAGGSMNEFDNAETASTPIIRALILLIVFVLLGSN